MSDPDWNRVREAVERVIAKHERQIRNQRAREFRATMRGMQKAMCLAAARIRAEKMALEAPWPMGAAQAAAYFATIAPQIMATPSRVFRTDKPEVDPLRAKALERLRYWRKPRPKTFSASVNIRGANG